ncbi:MAG: AI-2E family transporter [Elusimicrobiota bacterium]|jgi:AI-2 transport protein TqsA|nr:AI-2E family transporter [Elusimicrobiota bacterium]
MHSENSKHPHSEKPKNILAAVVGEKIPKADIYSKINTACLIIIAAVSLTIALIYTKSILIPLVISIFIFTMITPLVRYIKYRFHFPHLLAVITASIVVVVPLVLVVLFLINSVSNFVHVAHTYQNRLIEMSNWLVNYAQVNDIPVPDGILEVENLKNMLTGPTVTDFLKRVGNGTFKFFSYSLVVLIFLFFLLISSSGSKVTNKVIKEMQNKISAYLYIHITLSILTGLCVGVVYYSSGLELALMFVVLTIILNFIPNVGSIIAVLLPLPIALIQFDISAEFFMILIIPACMQFLIGSILEPKLLGDGVGLHPVAVIGSLIFWALVWGVPGAFMATPITAAIRIILSKIEPTRGISEILAGRLPK